MPPGAPKTDPHLLKSLKKAAKRGLTAEEIQRQRVSYVYGNLPKGSTLTCDEVEKVLARSEGKAA